MEQRVVHVNKDPFDVYIGRVNKRANLPGSVWANPFRIGAPHPAKAGETITREDAVALYKEWIVRGEGRRLLKRLGELEGETLGCWCAKKGGVGAHDPLICHGQILLLLLEHRRRKIEKKKKGRRTSGANGDSGNLRKRDLSRRAGALHFLRLARLGRDHPDKREANGPARGCGNSSRWSPRGRYDSRAGRPASRLRSGSSGSASGPMGPGG